MDSVYMFRSTWEFWTFNPKFRGSPAEAFDSMFEPSVDSVYSSRAEHALIKSPNLQFASLPLPSGGRTHQC